MFNLFIKYYADNTTLNPGTGGDTIATDDIGGVKHELVKVEFGDPNSATQVSPTNPLPVIDAVAETALVALVAGQQSNGLTDTQLRATPVPVSVTSDIEIGAVELKNGTDDTRATVTPANALKVDGSAVTQPVSASSLPLPTDAATAANQATQISSLANLDVPLSTRTKPSDQQHTIIDSGTVAVSNFPATQPISAASLPLPTNAAQESGGNLAAAATSLVSIDLGIPASLGQKVMAQSMPVTIASDQSAIPVTFSGNATDNTSLLSTTLNATGATSGLDTTGYLSVVLQLTGSWVGNLLVEASNDDSNWETTLVFDLNEANPQDAINENGIYVFKTTSKYIRLNVQQLQSGSITVLVLGRTVPGIDAAERLTLAMDRNNNMPLYTQDITGSPKKDVAGATIISDAPTPIYGYAASTNAVIFNIDTTGYNTVSIQGITVGSNITIQSSNDGITWTAINGFTSASGSPTSIISAASIHVFPASGRYMRGVMGGANFTNVLVYLRQEQMPISYYSVGLPINLISAGGNSIATPVNGAIAVGGNTANGVAPTANPNLIGGIDTSGLTRRILTDTSGRLTVASLDQSNTTRPINSVSPSQSIQNVAALSVSDTSQFEGQSQIELLSQILLELRILNQNISELPIALQSQNGKLDDPLLFRNDPTVFAN